MFDAIDFPVITLIYTILLVLLGLFIAIVLLRPSTKLETLVALLLTTIMLFYYTSAFQSWLSQRKFLDISIVKRYGRRAAGFLEEGHADIIGRLPGTDGITIFGKTYFETSVDKSYDVSWWPLILLLLGLMTRIVVDKYVHNERLRSITKEYWLFITAYVIVAFIISDLTGLKFLTFILALIVAIIIFSVDIPKVIGDGLNALKRGFQLFVKAIRILLMWLAYLAAEVGRVLKRLSRFVRTLYERYIAEPIRRIYDKIVSFLNREEDRVRAKLDGQDIED